MNKLTHVFTDMNPFGGPRLSSSGEVAVAVTYDGGGIGGNSLSTGSLVATGA